MKLIKCMFLTFDIDIYIYKHLLIYVRNRLCKKHTVYSINICNICILIGTMENIYSKSVYIHVYIYIYIYTCICTNVYRPFIIINIHNIVYASSMSCYYSLIEKKNRNKTLRLLFKHYYF